MKLLTSWKRRIFKNDKFKIPILNYADDGLLLSKSVKEAEYSIRLIQRLASENGLNINQEKSNILIYSMKEQPLEITVIKETNKMKYLGVTRENKNDCLSEHKKRKVK